MSSGKFGLRLATWYATLFVAGSIVIVVLTYVLTALSLEQRDLEVMNQKLGEYASVYERGGNYAATLNLPPDVTMLPKKEVK